MGGMKHSHMYDTKVIAGIDLISDTHLTEYTW